MIEKRKEERKKNETYQESRDRLISWVSVMIYKHIKYSEEFIHPPTTGAMLFNEEDYLLPKWEIFTTHGFCSTLPLFVYSLKSVKYQPEKVTFKSIQRYITKIFNKL